MRTRRTASSSRCTAAASSAWRAREYGIAWFAPVFEDLQSLGFEGTIESLTLDAAREIEPSLGDDARFVVRTSVDRYVRPESLMAGLAAKLRGQGVELREHVEVTGLRRNGAGWIVETNGGSVGPRRSSWPPARPRRRC